LCEGCDSVQRKRWV